MQQVFLIADGVSKVGKIIVQRLSGLGHRVYYGSDAHAIINAGGGMASTSLHLDLGEENSISAGVTRLLKAEGRIDVLVNNVNSPVYGALEVVETNFVERHLNECLVGMVRLQNEILPVMRAQRQGRIVTVVHDCTDLGRSLCGWQQVVSNAQLTLAATLVEEVKGTNITVDVVNSCLNHKHSRRPYDLADADLHNATVPTLWRQFTETVQMSFQAVPDAGDTACQIVDALVGAQTPSSGQAGQAGQADGAYCVIGEKAPKKPGTAVDLYSKLLGHVMGKSNGGYSE
jgi:NADP-dependent 3-hydroxy acid dehydrogenase YdfG